MTTTLAPTPSAACTPATKRSATRLVTAQLTLLGIDVGGGVLAVASGVNTWGEAWGTAALLAAPLPMMVGQAVLAGLATSTRKRWGSLPAGLLALACFVSIASGFFDGGLGNPRLTGWLTAYQVVLLALTGCVGVLALLRARALLRLRPTPRPSPPVGRATSRRSAQRDRSAMVAAEAASCPEAAAMTTDAIGIG